MIKLENGGEAQGLWVATIDDFLLWEILVTVARFVCLLMFITQIPVHFPQSRRYVEQWKKSPTYGFTPILKAHFILSFLLSLATLLGFKDK